MDPVQIIMDKLNALVMYMSHLEQSIISLSTNNYMLSQYCDMLARKLVESNIITDEKMKADFTEEVGKPMQEYISNMQKKIQDQQEAIKAQQEELKKKSNSPIILPGNENLIITRN